MSPPAASTGTPTRAPLVLSPECLQNGRGLQATGGNGGNRPVDSKRPDSLAIARKACAVPDSSPVGTSGHPAWTGRAGQQLQDVGPQRRVVPLLHRARRPQSVQQQPVVAGRLRVLPSPPPPPARRRSRCAGAPVSRSARSRTCAPGTPVTPSPAAPPAPAAAGAARRPAGPRAPRASPASRASPPAPGRVPRWPVDPTAEGNPRDLQKSPFSWCSLVPGSSMPALLRVAIHPLPSRPGRD